MKIHLLAASTLLGIVLHGPLSIAQPSPAPGPSAAATVNAGNTTGSIAYYCSNRANLQALLSSPSNQASAGLGVTIPANLSDASNIQSIAQVGLFSTQRHHSVFAKVPFAILRHVHGDDRSTRFGDSQSR